MEDKEKLLEYLQSFDLLVLATSGTSPSAATVHYGVEDTFTFYIITPPTTEHAKNIANNPEIACVVVDTKQKMYETKTKVGVQIKGKALLVTDRQEIKRALMVWSQARGDVVDLYLQKMDSGEWTSRPFKIVPTEIKWFNEELYGEEGVKTFKFGK